MSDLDGPLWIDVLATAADQEGKEPAQLHQKLQAVVVGLDSVGQGGRLELEHDPTELRDMEQGLEDESAEAVCNAVHRWEH